MSALPTPSPSSDLNGRGRARPMQLFCGLGRWRLKLFVAFGCVWPNGKA
jgi:hypothetical protein